MTKLLISDTADAVIRRKSDGHVFISAETQLTSLAQSLGINEKIFGGIGNKPLAIMRGQKEITSTLRNAFFDLELLSMTQGVAIDEDGTASVYKRDDDLTVTDNAGALEVTITDTTVTTVYVRNKDGVTVSATAATGKVTVPTGHAVANDKVSVTYKKSVTGNVVTFDADKFSEAYEIEYHTIGYDPATNQVVKDIYIQLDNAVPSADFEMSFENGTAIAPEITFDALTPPNSREIGRIIEVDRA
ncbi:hypothetical protein [Bacillus sp. T33-2]|uniref:hypothetical protein n=1 Tax=Bacillus sp. T33-2 TaxID=2054168 RepID=UPI000C76F972|nr:hypothetical protein [Bacillus sp. T33-2]PLR99646.1 hypothetical protein CVD19_00880 [Bacillus sp. T33-2]